MRPDGTILLAEYDPSWPRSYEREEQRIRGALGERALVLEHAGSTSVPGLPAKPVIDIVLAVADSADEAAYVPDLETAGYRFAFREPEWHEHRMLKGPEIAVNLHVFTVGSVEVERMLRFRDRLRTDAADRERYLAAKRELAARRWRVVQEYADAKAGVVEDILTRAG